ncbi:MAG TPA: sigma-54 dependent transcriptional regulator [Candidatus Omnitrophota bacterium]|nr:sigma-54 dependent transcriptional regulator [Candidatus Omnitrophota bacterium]HPD85206.1 sigma-54 dependent transcriptional regulator [Candidatus Omnitrophota bacterium]HRZ04293.1 sigma-54 dependent transcriptional regulator [Candidatus Omnitrophota bacterium]
MLSELKKYNILVVDDEPLIRNSLYEILRIQGYNALTAQSGEEALEVLKRQPMDIIITDMQLPKMNGIELLRLVKQKSPDTEVILITGFGTIESAVDAMKKGAFDYVTKPIIDSEIKMTIQKILEKKKILEENKDLRQAVAQASRSSYHGLTGASQKMQKIYSLIDSVASTKATILITGESGTGKGLVASAVHKADPNRKDKPFVEVSCGALSETLLESELFGHVKGAFTSAIRDNIGRFERAQEGTVFLDEIDSFSPNLQGKLLRVLQDGVYERVGDTQIKKTNARIIVATNRNLTELVASGKFREDLYYRINVIPITLPPLRERKEDIDLLVSCLVGLHSKKNNKKITGISDEVREIFLAYHWPGNIRQLENAIEVAVIMAKTPVINKWDLPETFRTKDIQSKPENGKSLKEGLQKPEKELILATLEESNWNRNAAAAALGINRTTLYNKMKKYGISFKKQKDKVA